MAITERKGPVDWYNYYYGLSTDVKPVGVPIGSIFMESNTGKRFETADGTNWFQVIA